MEVNEYIVVKISHLDQIKKFNQWAQVDLWVDFYHLDYQFLSFFIRRNKFLKYFERPNYKGVQGLMIIDNQWVINTRTGYWKVAKKPPQTAVVFVFYKGLFCLETSHGLYFNITYVRYETVMLFARHGMAVISTHKFKTDLP